MFTQRIYPPSTKHEGKTDRRFCIVWVSIYDVHLLVHVRSGNLCHGVSERVSIAIGKELLILIQPSQLSITQTRGPSRELESS